MQTVVSVKKPVGGLGSGGTPRRNGSMRRPRIADSRPGGGSLVCGNAANSISLLAMSKPPRRLRSRWRIRDRVRRGGVGCNRERYGRPHVLEPTRAQLADKRFSAVDVGIRVERERRKVVDDRPDGLTGIAPVD